MNHCLRHYDEPIAGVCRACKQPFCTRCLVFSFGPKKPPYCLGCALYASGIRNGTRQLPAAPTGDDLGPPTGGPGAPAPAPDKRAERARRRAEREAVKVAEKAARKAARSASRSSAPPPVPEAAPMREGRAGQVPAPSVLLTNAVHQPGSHPA